MLDVSHIVNVRRSANHAAVAVKLYGVLTGALVGLSETPVSFIAIPVALGIVWASFRFADALRRGRVALSALLVAVLVLSLIFLSSSVLCASLSIAGDTAPDVVYGLIALSGPPAFFLMRSALSMIGYRRSRSARTTHELVDEPNPWEGDSQVMAPRLFTGKRPVRVRLFFTASRMALVIALAAGLVGASNSTPRAVSLLARMVLFISLPGAALLYRRARRYAALEASEIRRRDTRPIILYLRSFGDDRIKIGARAGNGRSWIESRVKVGFEEVIVDHLWRYGPVVAVGQPGDDLPPLGAARDYISNETWQRTIEQWMTEACIITVVVGRTQGLAWEVNKLVDLNLTHKVVLLLPPVKEPELSARWEHLCNLADKTDGLVLARHIDVKRTLAVVPHARGDAHIIAASKRDNWTYEIVLELAAELILARTAAGAFPQARR